MPGRRGGALGVNGTARLRDSVQRLLSSAIRALAAVSGGPSSNTHFSRRFGGIGDALMMDEAAGMFRDAQGSMRGGASGERWRTGNGSYRPQRADADLVVHGALLFASVSRTGHDEADGACRESVQPGLVSTTASLVSACRDAARCRLVGLHGVRGRNRAESVTEGEHKGTPGVRDDLLETTRAPGQPSSWRGIV